jgi:hypothetical protein
MDDNVKTFILIVAVFAVGITLMYGLSRLSDWIYAQKEERAVAVLTRSFNVTSEDARMIFGICRNY